VIKDKHCRVINVADTVSGRMLRHKEREKKQYERNQELLPSYFYNISGRIGLNTKLEKSLRQADSATVDTNAVFSSFVTKGGLKGKPLKPSKYLCLSS
jgi:hypothetical protein